MSKAVLVMDMPEKCNECCLSYPVEDKVERILCRGCAEYHSTTDFTKKPDWCPLRELPARRGIAGIYPQPDNITPSYKVGWNACLDAIEGTEEEDVLF
ncbi:MAG: hypothetical protein UFG06_13940 [Lachnospiraceae bacterium]|nr:hypothetical protein [Lachnospiraceae bacterium]